MVDTSKLIRQAHAWTTEVRLNVSFNRSIQFFADPFRSSRYVPDWLWKRLPIVGTFPVDLGAGKSFLYHSIGEEAGKALYWKGPWAFEEGSSKLVYALAKSARVFFDVGAYVGFYTLLVKTANPDVSIFAFEPVPSIHERLSDQIAANDMNSGTTIERAVLSDISAEDVPLFVPRHRWATASSLLADYKRVEKDEILVRSYSLDDYVGERGIQKIDLMKVDVEGAEIRVLRGGEITLRRDRPMVLCEILPQGEANLEDLEGLLQSMRYEAALIGLSELGFGGPISPDSTRVHKNFLLCPAERVEEARALYAICGDCFSL